MPTIQTQNPELGCSDTAVTPNPRKRRTMPDHNANHNLQLPADRIASRAAVALN
jgi:hypothetical protein